MGIYSHLLRRRVVQELEISGGSDADTLKDDEEDNNDDQATDYNADADRQELDEDEPDTEDDSETDYTLPDDEPEPTDDSSDTNEEDNTEDNDDNNEDSNNSTDSDNNDADTNTNNQDNNSQDQSTDEPLPDEPDLGDDTDSTDYTDDSNVNDTSSTDTSDASTSTDDATSNSEDPNNDIQQLEKNLLADLSPQQMAIKNTELKSRFIDIYNLVDNIITRCNSLTKTEEMIDTLDFVIKKLVDMKEMIYYYITNTYFTKTYVDNSIMYQQYLVTLNTLSSILVEIRPQDK